MVLKGISRGDSSFKHFTFDDEDIVMKGGIFYYKVNYGKNKLEGEFAEDEIGFVECSKVMTLGGKKPRPIEEVKPEFFAGMPSPKTSDEKPTKNATKEVKIRTSKEKTTKTSTKSTKSKIKENKDIVENPDSSYSYEYNVVEIISSNIEDLQSELNNLGDDGWELCGFDTNKSLFGDIHIITIFKRKRG